jgi:hypothetical protein
LWGQSDVYEVCPLPVLIVDLDDGPSVLPLAEKRVVVHYKRALYRYPTMSLVGRAAVDPGLRQSTQSPACPWALRPDSSGTRPVLDRVGYRSAPRCESELTCRRHRKATSIHRTGHYAEL